MPRQKRSPSRLLELEHPGDQLIVRTRAEAYRRNLSVATVLAAVVLGLMVAYLMAARTHPGLWIATGAAAVLFGLIVLRAYDVRQTMREDVYLLDRNTNAFSRNGDPIAPVSDISHVLVREVHDEGRPLEEYALVVSLNDTRRITIVESVGLPDGKAQIEGAARRIAEYAGVPVQEGSRGADQWWLDR
ncbi:MAG TPA: hypothetical protein VLH79_08620 [Chthonomonadales bacterium]|nr:hypothetical protein [Chthonomonadales bacterium]